MVKSNQEIEISEFKVTNTEEIVVDPLLDCFKGILTLYGIQADLEGLVASLARDKDAGHLKLSEVSSLAKQLGFNVDVRKGKLKSFEATNLPIIVLCKDDAAWLYLPQRTHQGKMYKPGVGVVDAELDSLKESFIGRVMILRPDKIKNNAETEHMTYGHMIDWFWKPILSYWHIYSEVILCSVFINLFVLALPLFTMNVYDRVVTNFVPATLQVLTMGIMLAVVFDFLFKLIRSYLLDRVAMRVGLKYDFDLMEHLLTIRQSEISMSVGEKSNIFRELQSLKDFYASKLAPTLVDVPFFLLFLLVIHLIAPGLVFIPVAGAVIIIVINLMVQIFINRTTHKYFASIQNKSSVMIETLSGTSAIRACNGIGERLFKWNVISSLSAEQSRKNGFLLSFASNVAYLVTHLVHISVLFFGAYEINDGNLTVGGLIACTILSGRAIGPIIGLAGVIAKLKQSQDVLKTIDAIFKIPSDTLLTSKTAPKGPYKGKITLKNVKFQYQGQTNLALNDVSLTIEAGDKVGLIGRSGAGKSTIANVMTGILKQQMGEIFLDKYSYENISPAELSRVIGVVPQEGFFFKGSLKDNILMGDGFDMEANLDRAIQVSGLDLVMEQTGFGLDMEVAESGSNLSGGHKQAVALARVLVRDPQIIIFDEPTTGMDNVLEARIKLELTKYLKDKTFVMVTHRTTLLSIVDRLVVMDKGRIVADGPRDAILKKIGGGV